jgi:hypothetical protein
MATRARNAEDHDGVDVALIKQPYRWGRRLAGLALLGAVALGAGSRAAAQVVVLAARGPSASSYPAGTVLKPSQTVTLQRGDSLEVLDAGGSRVITGPQRVAVGYMDQKTRNYLADFLKTANGRRPGIMATRGGFLLSDHDTRRPPTAVEALWLLDASKIAERADGGPEADSPPQDVCLLPDSAPTFLDDGVSEPETALANSATGTPVPMSWQAGAHLLSWPTRLPIADGDRYTLNVSGWPSTVLIFRTISEQPKGLSDLAAALSDRGCYYQLEMLATSAANP